MLSHSIRSVVARLPKSASLNPLLTLTSALHGKQIDTVYDNIEGGPKVRGIDLLRDPYLNKVWLPWISIICWLFNFLECTYLKLGVVP